jgi:dTDP-glucose 4,6-dehydratase
VSRGELAILEHGAIGRIYHLSPDQGVPVRDLVHHLCERLGRSFDQCTESVPERPGQDAAYVIDSGRARQELGWRPTIPLSDGLSETIDWINANWQQIKDMPLSYQHRA